MPWLGSVFTVVVVTVIIILICIIIIVTIITRTAHHRHHHHRHHHHRCQSLKPQAVGCRRALYPQSFAGRKLLLDLLTIAHALFHTCTVRPCQTIIQQVANNPFEPFSFKSGRANQELSQTPDSTSNPTHCQLDTEGTPNSDRGQPLSSAASAEGVKCLQAQP